MNPILVLGLVWVGVLAAATLTVFAYWLGAWRRHWREQP